MLNYYDVLEVSPNASAGVIRAAYKSLIQRHHPDKLAGDASANQRATLIIEAYENLSDPEKRAAFDRMLKAAQWQQYVPPQTSAHVARSGSNGIEAKWPVVLAVLAAISYLAWETLQPSPPGKQSAMHIETPADAARMGTAPEVIARQLDVWLVNRAPDGREERFVLHVPRITLTIAASAEGVRQRMRDVIDEIEPALEARLAQASYISLIAKDGEDYLCGLIKDELVSHILSGDNPEAWPGLKEMGAGVVLKVGLPESYSVQRQ